MKLRRMRLPRLSRIRRRAERARRELNRELDDVQRRLRNVNKEIRAHPNNDSLKRKRARLKARERALKEKIGEKGRFIKRVVAVIRRKLRFRPDFNGCPTYVTRAVRKAIVRANRHHLYVTATSNGGHSSTSYHYRKPCAAVDVAGAYSDLVAYQRSEARRGSGRYNELFGPDGFYIKNGARYSGHFPDHEDHDHNAPRS